MFESDLDRERQQRVAAILGPLWNCDLLRTGPFAFYDWFAKRLLQVVGVAELKVRNNQYDDYETVYLSLNKALGLAAFNLYFSRPGVFVACFTDGIYARRISRLDLDRYHIGVRGRTDRGAANDLEPIVLVPVTDMKRICDAAGVY